MLPGVPWAQQNPVPGSSEDRAQSAKETVSGLGVIVNVGSTDGVHVVYADGYRIRIHTPATAVTFSGALKSLDDVGPDTWIRYEGMRDETGAVVARRAEFYPAGTRKAFTTLGPRKSKRAPDYQAVKQDSLLDADGHFVNPRTKVRYSDAGGPCGWHRVPADAALQERVERVGMRLVPAYQKELAQDSPSRIPFRFYAVAEDKVRSVFACNTGLVLVPKNVVERLENDDQLAAVLADGVAFNLVRQQTTAVDALEMSTEVAAGFAGGAPGMWAAGPAAGAVIGRERMLRLERQCARIALQLMSLGGYDPWQAPEAWRRLGPRDMPQDGQALEYTREGKYQLGILNAQYKRAGVASADGRDTQR